MSVLSRIAEWGLIRVVAHRSYTHDPKSSRNFGISFFTNHPSIQALPPPRALIDHLIVLTCVLVH